MCATKINSLPTEILELIFVSCIPQCLPRPSSPPRDHKEMKNILSGQPQNSISLVCKRWRTVALTNVWLWSQWFFNLRNLPMDLIPQLTSTLSQWLRRSKDSPLTVFLYITVRRTEGEGYAALERLYDLLHASRSRWCKIGLQIVYASRETPAPKSIKLDYSILRNLQELHITESPQFYAIKGKRTADLQVQHLPSFPCLRTFRLSMRRDNSDPNLFPGYLLMLQNMPQLDFLEWSISNDYCHFKIMALPIPIIELSNLRHLILNVSGQRSLGAHFVDTIMDHLETPSLSTLRLKSRFEFASKILPPPPPDYVFRFIQRNTPPLITLSLNMYTIDGSQLSEIVQLLPSLGILVLRLDLSVPGVVLDTLLKRQSEETGGGFLICPQLSYFEFPLGESHIERAFDLLEHRWDAELGRQMKEVASMWKRTLAGNTTDKGVYENDFGTWLGYYEKWDRGLPCVMRFGQQGEPDSIPHHLRRGLIFSSS